MANRYHLVAIQMQVHLEQYATPQAFEKKIHSLLSAVRKRVHRTKRVLVVFPEDVGLGLLFTPDYDSIRFCETTAQVREVLARKYQKAIEPLLQGLNTKEGGSLTRLLIRLLSPKVEAIYRETFSRAARQFGYWIVAGSAPLAGGEKVYNTTYSFNPDGELVQVQRKVHLVPLEQSGGLDLSEAAPETLGVFKTPFGTVGVLICYDAFHRELVDRVVKSGATLLAQPSFNPPLWNEAQAQEWETGLFATVQRYKGVIGINPMMVGSLFEIKPTGRSSIVAHVDLTPDKSGYLARAKTCDQEEILVYSSPVLGSG